MHDPVMQFPVRLGYWWHAIRRVARRTARAEGDAEFGRSELRDLRRMTGSFSDSGGVLILALLTADVLALAPGLSLAGVLSAASAATLFAIGFLSRGASDRWLRPVFFASASLALVASALLQVEEQPSKVFAFHIVAMAPVAAAAFARWTLRWHVGWLGAMVTGLVGIQILTALVGPDSDTSLQFFASFVAGAVVSVAVLAALRLERYRSYVLLRRIARVSQRAVRAKAALSLSLEQLRQSQLTIRKLEGILPACASCGRVRTDDDSEWLPLAEYLIRRGAVAISHGLCPDCYARIVKTEFGEG
jgi:uncharacterized membrane protein YjjP (DUF1212 family)